LYSSRPYERNLLRFTILRLSSVSPQMRTGYEYSEHTLRPAAIKRWECSDFSLCPKPWHPCQPHNGCARLESYDIDGIASRYSGSLAALMSMICLDTSSAKRGSVVTSGWSYRALWKKNREVISLSLTEDSFLLVGCKIFRVRCPALRFSQEPVSHLAAFLPPCVDNGEAYDI